MDAERTQQPVIAIPARLAALRGAVLQCLGGHARAWWARQRRAEPTAMRYFVLALALTLVATAVAQWTSLQRADSEQQVQASRRVLHRLAVLSASLGEYAAVFRSYPVLRDAPSRLRLAEVKTLVVESFAHLANIIERDSANGVLLANAKQEFASFEDYADRTIIVLEREGPAAAFARISGSAGFANIQESRVLLADLQLEQERELAGLADQAAGRERAALAAGWTVLVVQVLLVALGYLLLRDEMRRRAQSAEALAASEAMLRANFEQSGVGIAHVGTDRRILRSNHALERMFGRTAAELAGVALTELSHPEDRDALTPDRERLYAGEITEITGEKRYLRADGGTFWARVTVSLACDAAGAPEYEIAVFQDISDRKRARRALRERDAQLALLAENTPAMICYFDLNGRYRYANRAYREFYAPGTRSLEGRNVLDVVGAELWDAIRSHYAQAGAGEQVRYERSHRRADGSVRDVDVMLVPHRDARGRMLGIYSLILDVTERKSAETATRQSEERLQLAVDASGVVIWDTNLATGAVYLGERWTAILGGDPQETRTTLGALMAIVHPEDLERVRSASILAMKKDIPAFSEELRIRRLDGEWRWISVSGRVVETSGRRALRMAGTVSDIDARKHAERLLATEHLVTRELARAPSVTVGIKAALGALCNAEGWHLARYFQVDEAAGLLRFTECWIADETRYQTLMEDSRELVFRPDEGIAGLVWRNGAAQWVPDMQADGRVVKRPLTARYGVRGAFVFPVHSDEKVIGVIAAFSLSVRKPDARLMNAVDAIGRQIGQFLQRKQAEERALTLGARLAVYAASSPVVSYVLQFAGDQLRPVWVSENIERLFGYGVGESLAEGWWIAHLHPEDRARAIDEARKLASDDALSHEYRFLRKDGSIVWVLDEMRVVRDASGTPVQTVGAWTSIDDRKRIEANLQRLANFDVVTGLPNRVLFRDRLEQSLMQARRNDWQVGLLFVDLDQFKRINDTLGHGGGDDLLRTVGMRLQAMLRAGDTLARFGGDEFAVVLPDLESPEAARVVAQKMLDSLGQPVNVGGKELFAGASIGIAAFPHDALDAETLLQCADAAMYEAKRKDRNSYRFFTPEMNAQSTRLLELERDLRHAITRGEFELHYQPKADVTGTRITGAEALLRWRRPDGRLASPAEFIPVLEDSGMIVEVGDWVILEGCRQIMRWNGALPQRLRIAVNASARQFARGDLLDSVKKALAETGCAPQRLEIEVTESMVMHDVGATVATLQGLRALGVRIAVDDFGTGHSSLAYLKKLPLDVVKIDRSFVRDLSENANDAAIAKAIIGMAQALGYEVVAEGVETESQRQFLEAHGCHQIQGYLLAKPMPAVQLMQWLSERTKRGQDPN